MKSTLPLLLSALLLGSCSTAFKTGQTPDDLYFSPERPQHTYVDTEREEDRTSSRNERRRYSEIEEAEDRYLRMRVRNRMWRTLDDPFYSPYYSYNPYYQRYYNNGFNTYTFWNHYYNPYYRDVIVVNPKSPVYNRPRTTNLHVFDREGNINPKAPRVFNPSAANSSRDENNYRNSGTDAGTYLRRQAGSSSSSSGSTSSQSSGSSGSSSKSSGSSSSGSSGSNAPVRKF